MKNKNEAFEYILQPADIFKHKGSLSNLTKHAMCYRSAVFYSSLS